MFPSSDWARDPRSNENRSWTFEAKSWVVSATRPPKTTVHIFHVVALVPFLARDSNRRSTNFYPRFLSRFTRYFATSKKQIRIDKVNFYYFFSHMRVCVCVCLVSPLAIAEAIIDRSVLDVESNEFASTVNANSKMLSAVPTISPVATHTQNASKSKNCRGLIQKRAHTLDDFMEGKKPNYVASELPFVIKVAVN